MTKTNTLKFLNNLLLQTRRITPGLRAGYYEFTSGYYYDDKVAYHGLQFEFGLKRDGIIQMTLPNRWLLEKKPEELTAEQLLARMDEFVGWTKAAKETAGKLGFQPAESPDTFILDLCQTEFLGQPHILRLKLIVEDESTFQLNVLEARNDGWWKLLGFDTVGWFEDDKRAPEKKLASGIHRKLFHSEIVKSLATWGIGNDGETLLRLPEWLRMEMVEEEREKA